MTSEQDIVQDSSDASVDVDQEKQAIEAFLDLLHSKDSSFEPPMLDKAGLAPWSISKLKVLRKCPLQFYLKYMLKAKVPGDIPGKSDSTSADVGSAAHLILEHVMGGKPVQEAYKIAKKSFVPSKLSEEIWREKLETVEYNIIAFKERMDALGTRHGIRRVLMEMRIAVNHDWEPTGFFSDDCYMRGVVDLIIQLNNGDLIIIDHKYGGGEGSIRPYEDQLNSYKVLYHYGVAPINGAQSFIHYIAAGEVKPSYYSGKDDIEGKLKGMLEFDIEGAIDAVAEKGYMKHVCGSYCKWCDYSYVCKSKEKYLKPLELGTKRFFEIKQVS